MTKTNTKPAFKLIEGAAAIDKAITSISTRGKKLDRDIWQAAVSAMAHHAQHGDVTLVNRLVEAMPKGSRVNALREFIMAHGKVGWHEEKKVFVHDKEGTFDLEGALSVSWVEFKPEPAYVPFDAEAALRALMKKVENADPTKGDKVPAGLVERLSAIMADIQPEPAH
jgi:hypothetical protein